jgi:hypothetical protein
VLLAASTLAGFELKPRGINWLCSFVSIRDIWSYAVAVAVRQKPLYGDANNSVVMVSELASSPVYLPICIRTVLVV